MQNKINEIAKTYSEAFEENGRSPSAVLCPKGRQNLRYSKMLENINLRGASILDFGSGLGHLFEYLTIKSESFTYTGVDICQEFLDDCNSQFSKKGAKFIHLKEFEQNKYSFDYVMSIGTFNIKYFNDADENWKFVSDSLLKLWEVTNKALILNWMTDRVDFTQDQAFHMPPEKILSWGVKHFSNRFLINQTYMPYEYHITFFKNAEIERPGNVFTDC